MWLAQVQMRKQVLYPITRFESSTFVMKMMGSILGSKTFYLVLFSILLRACVVGTRNLVSRALFSSTEKYWNQVVEHRCGITRYTEKNKSPRKNNNSNNNNNNNNNNSSKRKKK